MTSQPRSPAGARHGTVAAGGRWTSKPVPDVVDGVVGFNDLVGAPSDWTERSARLRWALVTFTRSVVTTVSANQVVTITTDCDLPHMKLLAKKGDVHYWNGDKWNGDHQTRKLWCADITAQMLQEGLVDTAYPDVIGGVQSRCGGIHTAMDAASNNKYRPRGSVHVLTGAVAQLRGLRLLQSMAPDDGWETKLGNHTVPTGIRELQRMCFVDAAQAYKKLPRPPWEDGVPWGPQYVAGLADANTGGTLFVGEHGDLLWKTLTETERHGSSPLKQGLRGGFDRTETDLEMVVAAALYDKTAQRQLTHGLFDGVAPDDRAGMQRAALAAFTGELNPPSGRWSRWTDVQQQQLREFVAIVEALEP